MFVNKKEKKQKQTKLVQKRSILARETELQ